MFQDEFVDGSGDGVVLGDGNVVPDEIRHQASVRIEVAGGGRCDGTIWVVHVLHVHADRAAVIHCGAIDSETLSVASTFESAKVATSS